MTTRRIAVVLTALVLALAVAGVTSRPATATSFVDKQVQAGSLLIQKYVDAYGLEHHFSYPTRAMVKKGGGLTAPIWPANPWTGKIMGPGSARGTYTYTPSTDGTSYRLIVHLSKGNYPLGGGIPKWFQSERNTAAKQNLLLLQRYIETYAAAHGDSFPAATDVTPAVFGAGYSWPMNPWTGADMIAGDALGDFRYTGGGTTYSLKVKLTTGWSTPFGPVSMMSRLTTTPGG